MPKRKTRSRKQNAQSGSKTTLPKGYEAITRSNASWPNESTNVGDMLEAEILEFDTVKVKRGKKTESVDIARVETKEGATFTLWHSAGLAPIFEYEEGTNIAVIYDGIGQAKRGQNPPRLYRIGVK